MLLREMLAMVVALGLTVFAGIRASSEPVASPEKDRACGCCGPVCSCPSCVCDNATALANETCDCCGGSTCYLSRSAQG